VSYFGQFGLFLLFWFILDVVFDFLAVLSNFGCFGLFFVAIFCFGLFLLFWACLAILA